jgi:hypothetical protein
MTTSSITCVGDTCLDTPPVNHSLDNTRFLPTPEARRSSSGGYEAVVTLLDISPRSADDSAQPSPASASGVETSAIHKAAEQGDGFDELMQLT